MMERNDSKSRSGTQWHFGLGISPWTIAPSAVIISWTCVRRSSIVGHAGGVSELTQGLQASTARPTRHLLRERSVQSLGESVM